MQLTTLYNNINQQGMSAIRNHQEQLDSNLLNPDKDMRRGLTLTASLPAHVSRNIMFCLQKLAAIEPNQYFYPPADLHITIIDLIAASSDFSLSTFEEEKYKNVVGQIISQIGPIHWQLAGMITSSGALLVKGYYSAELSQKVKRGMRKKVRKNEAFRPEMRQFSDAKIRAKTQE